MYLRLPETEWDAGVELQVRWAEWGLTLRAIRHFSSIFLPVQLIRNAETVAESALRLRSCGGRRS